MVAGLWPVTDREALPLMVSLYRHLMTHSPAEALAFAQREALTAPDSNPIMWSVFALFGDPRSIPPPFPGLQWLARLRQGWYRRRCDGSWRDLYRSDRRLQPIRPVM